MTFKHFAICYRMLYSVTLTYFYNQWRNEAGGSRGKCPAGKGCAPAVLWRTKSSKIILES